MRASGLLWVSLLTIAVDGYTLTFYDTQNGICDGEVLQSNVQLDSDHCYNHDNGLAPEISIRPDQLDDPQFAVKFYSDRLCKDPAPIDPVQAQDGCVGPRQLGYGSFEIVELPKISKRHEERRKKAKRGGDEQPNQAHHMTCGFKPGRKFKLRGKTYQWEEQLDESVLREHPELRGKVLGGVEIPNTQRRRQIRSTDINDPGFDLNRLRRRNPAGGSAADPGVGAASGASSAVDTNAGADPCEEDVTECTVVPEGCPEAPDRRNDAISLRTPTNLSGGGDDVQTAVDKLIIEVVKKGGLYIWDLIRNNPSKILVWVVEKVVVVMVAYWGVKSAQDSPPQCPNWETPHLTRGSLERQEFVEKLDLWKQAVAHVEEKGQGGKVGLRFGNESILSMELWYEAANDCRSEESVQVLNHYCDMAAPTGFVTSTIAP